MGVLYAKVNGAWEPVTGSATAAPDEVWVGATDPRVSTQAPDAEIWYDTTVPPGELKAWDGTAWQPTGAIYVAGDTVVNAAAFGALGAAVPGVAGTATAYSRADHSHGAPAHTGAEHAHVTPNDLADPVANLTMAGFGINNLLDPLAAQDAATKFYTDTAVTTAGTDAGLLVDDMTIAVVPTTSLTAAKTGTSATGDLTWTITLDSMTLANTYTGAGDPVTTPPVGVTAEPGDLYIDTTNGTAWIYDGAAWIQLEAPAGAGVNAVTAGPGIVVDATTPSVPVVSGVVDPLGSPLLTVSATGFLLDTTVATTDDIAAAATASAGAGLLENATTAGVIDVVAGAGVVVTADAVAVAFDAPDAATVGVADIAARSDHPGLQEVYVGGTGALPGDPDDPDIAFPGSDYELWFSPDGTPPPPVAPVISALSPNTSPVTGLAETVTAIGTGFVSGSVVKISFSDLDTTFVSDTELTFPLYLTTSGTAYPISVRNPDGQESNSVGFDITSPTAPTLTSLDPNPVSLASLAGGPMTLTVTGTGYVASSVIKANDAALPTTFVSDTSLTAPYTPAVVPDDYRIYVSNSPTENSLDVILVVTA